MEKLRDLIPENCIITELELLEREEGFPKVCHVVFESRPTECSLIRSKLWMPDNWNGIFVGLGNGGIAGQLAKGYWDYALKGYAVAQTDMGTSRVRSGEIKKADVNLWMDYTWRSTHIMTEVSKILIEGYYGRKPDYSYFVGSSAGGLQAFSEAQRFPEDYDGIVAGVPSNNALNMTFYLVWTMIHLRDKEGKAIFPRKEAKEISLHAAEFFQFRGDGEPGDDFITYPYADENTIKDFIAYLRGKVPQFTEQHFKALEAVYTGPKHPVTGEQIYCGIPIGSERTCSYFGDGEDDRFGFPWLRLFFGDDFYERGLDFAKDYDAYKKGLGDNFTAVNPDLSGMIANGGKFLVYTGAADPMGPWPDHVKYYNRVCDRFGGFEKVSEFFRLFIIPGKAHANNGLGGNRYWADESRTPLLDAVRRWREQGIVPEQITTAHIDVIEGEEGETESIKFIRKVDPYRGDKAEITGHPASTSDRLLGWN